MKKIMLAAVMVLSVVGCTSTTSNSSQAVANNSADKTNSADSKKDMICYHEKTIGSNRKSVRCMTKEDRDKSREVSREAFLRTQKSSSTGGG